VTDEKPSPGWSTDRNRRDREYDQIVEQAGDALQRLNALAAEWDEFVADTGRWGRDHGVETTPESLLVRLALVPGRLHHVGAEDFSEQRGREYGDLEVRSASLFARKSAIESELGAVHEDFHAWARRYGVELVVETATADIHLGGDDAGVLTGGVFARPPNGYVLNSISCRDIGNNLWRTVRRYCKIKS
jgi:hypothetical protein